MMFLVSDFNQGCRVFFLYMINANIFRYNKNLYIEIIPVHCDGVINKKKKRIILTEVADALF
jgi:hypothetical protein